MATARHYPSMLAPTIGSDEELCYPMAPVRTEPPMPTAALEHIDALYRLARHLTGSDADAEDLVQEAYARALAGHEQFVQGTNLRAWLFRILRNAYIDAYRRAQRSPVQGGLDDDDRPDTTSSSNEVLRGDGELDRLRTVVARDIETALAALSIDARTVILLDLEGLTEGELAEALGCSVGTIKSRLHRARAALRERLSDYAR